MNRIERSIGKRFFVKRVINQATTTESVHQQKDDGFTAQDLLRTQPVTRQTNNAAEPASAIEIFLIFCQHIQDLRLINSQ